MRKPVKKDVKGSPFEALKDLRKQLTVEERERGELKRQEQKVEQKKRATAMEESEMLARAMAGVKPIGDRPPPRPKATAPKVSRAVQLDEDEEVLQELRDIVGGSAPLDFTFSDEHVEGKAKDCSHLDLSKLRAGDFAVQGHLDLHGKNRDESRSAISSFFSESIKMSHRCVLVICGRGLNSPDRKPVLKELLVRWLVQGQLSYNVLAFSSAKAHDGGVGALYVLLRRNPRRPIA